MSLATVITFRHEEAVLDPAIGRRLTANAALG